jgi:hypothetical protein
MSEHAAITRFRDAHAARGGAGEILPDRFQASGCLAKRPGLGHLQRFDLAPDVLPVARQLIGDIH